MTAIERVDFVFGGPAKTATTWIYECLQSHPSVRVPDTDSLGYFDINYHRGRAWYDRRLPDSDGSAVVGDVSEGYLPSSKAPERIDDALPDTTLVFCVRNPVRRAFSHWWHGYGKGYHEYEFSNVFRSHSSFQWWIEPGFYAEHLERYRQYFSEDQIELLFFDDLKADDEAFVQDLYAAIGADDDFVPPEVGDTSNEATHAAPGLWMAARNYLRHAAPEWLKQSVLEPVYHTVRPLMESRSEYEEGIDPDLREDLEAIYRDDVRRLEEMTGRSFDHWFDAD